MACWVIYHHQHLTNISRCVLLCLLLDTSIDIAIYKTRSRTNTIKSWSEPPSYLFGVYITHGSDPEWSINAIHCLECYFYSGTYIASHCEHHQSADQQESHLEYMSWLGLAQRVVDRGKSRFVDIVAIVKCIIDWTSKPHPKCENVNLSPYYTFKCCLTVLSKLSISFIV